MISLRAAWSPGSLLWFSVSLLLACSSEPEEVAPDTSRGGTSTDQGTGGVLQPSSGGSSSSGGGGGSTGEEPTDPETSAGWLASLEIEHHPEDSNRSRSEATLARIGETGIESVHRIFDDSPPTAQVENLVWSPDGRHLAAIACTNPCQHRTAWLLTLGGSDDHTLQALPGPTADQSVQTINWSPDARHLFLTWTNDEALLVPVLAPQNGVVFGKPGYRSSLPTWSPDSTRAVSAFLDWVPGQLARTEVVTWSIDQALTHRTLSHTDGPNVSALSWSSTGDHLVYRTFTNGVYLASRTPEIWPYTPIAVHPQLTSAQRAQLLGFGFDSQLIFSAPNKASKTKLYSVDWSDGELLDPIDRSELGEARQVYSSSSHPLLLPQLDSSRRYLAFPTSTLDTDERELFLSDLATKDTPPTSLSALHELGALQDFAWIPASPALLVVASPSGEQGEDTPGREELYLLSLDGSRRMLTGDELGGNLVRGLPSLFRRFWTSEDGALLFFLRSRSGAPTPLEQVELVSFAWQTQSAPRAIAPAFSLSAEGGLSFERGALSRDQQWLTFSLRSSRGREHWLASLVNAQASLHSSESLVSSRSLLWQPKAPQPSSPD